MTGKNNGHPVLTPDARYFSAAPRDRPRVHRSGLNRFRKHPSVRVSLGQCAARRGYMPYAPGDSRGDLPACGTLRRPRQGIRFRHPSGPSKTPAKPQVWLQRLPSVSSLHFSNSRSCSRMSACSVSFKECSSIERAAVIRACVGSSPSSMISLRVDRAWESVNGVDSVSISKRLSHAQVSTTANIYAHVMEKAGQRNADILADIKRPEF